uniref:hypothetical protein n=1 Tax=Pseudomonas sp. UMAB-40 TaxID=1365407 RepID=UPI001C591BEB
MSNESKMVPVALLRNIEMTWRQASGFSNKANDLIETGLPELRDLLAAAPVAQQAETATCAKSQVGAQPVYQTQYMGEGGGGWVDVELAEYERDTRHDSYLTRIVYTHSDAGEVERLRSEI